MDQQAKIQNVISQHDQASHLTNQSPIGTKSKDKSSSQD